MNKYSKFLLISIFALLLVGQLVFAAAVNAAEASGETLVDKIVAVVDSHPILYSDVQEKVKRGPLVMISDFPSSETSSSFERALNDSINFELILMKARELEIDVTDEEVESQIKKLISGQNLSREGLDRFLEQQGKNYASYKKDFHRQMLLRRFQGRVVAPLVKITDKDVETYYLQSSGSQADSVQYNLRQILIKVAPRASVNIIAAKKALAAEVHQKIVGGTDFIEAVKLYSDGPSARSRGGLIQGVRLKDLALEIRAQVEHLEVGEFTEPIRTGLGFHIFALAEKKFTGSDEYLLQKNKLEYELRNKELGSQTRRWLSQAREQAKIKIIHSKLAKR